MANKPSKILRIVAGLLIIGGCLCAFWVIDSGLFNSTTKDPEVKTSTKLAPLTGSEPSVISAKTSFDLFTETPTVVVAHDNQTIAALIAANNNLPTIDNSVLNSSLIENLKIEKIINVSSQGFTIDQTIPNGVESLDIAVDCSNATSCDQADLESAQTLFNDSSAISERYTNLEISKKDIQTLADLALEKPEDQVNVIITDSSSLGSNFILDLANLTLASEKTLTVSNDLRANPEILKEISVDTKIAIFGDKENSASYLSQLAVVRSGIELPGGGFLVKNPEGSKQKMYIALYGHPSGGALGVLGEQKVPETIERVNKITADYQELDPETEMVPTLEIIATIASAFAEDDLTYSRKSKISELKPLIDAAEEAGVYVVLDLQPGRTDFLTQAKIYEEFLKRPNVGLALDPEWRLKPNQVHLREIGSVQASEINEVSQWMAELVQENDLPQKMLILHQFNLSMIKNRSDLDTSHSEVQILIHADGQGAQGAKVGTYEVLRKDAPENITWGWKNFYDEDTPRILTPAQTLAVEPRPEFVSYQ